MLAVYALISLSIAMVSVALFAPSKFLTKTQRVRMRNVGVVLMLGGAVFLGARRMMGGENTEFRASDELSGAVSPALSQASNISGGSGGTLLSEF